MDIRLSSVACIALMLVSQPLLAARGQIGEDEATKAYLHGRLAMSDQDYPLATDLFKTAARYEADPLLLRRALDVAMLSGDMASAVQLANQIQLPPSSEPHQALGDTIITLIRASDAIRKRDWRAYDAASAAYNAPGRGGESGLVLTQLLEAWGKAGRKDIDGALAILSAPAKGAIGTSYLQEHRAHMLAYAKRWDEAAAAYAAIIAGDGANVSRLRLAAAATLIESAPKDPAVRARAEQILAGGGVRDSVLKDARARLQADPHISGRKLGDLVETPARGFAMALVRLSADLLRERAVGAAINFGRMITIADPQLPDGWLILADVLVGAKRFDQAQAALQPVPDTPMWASMKQTRLTNILVGGGQDTATARARLEAQTRRPDVLFEDYARLADFERGLGNRAAAIAAYDKALAHLPGQKGAMHGQLYFLRGSLKEQMGDWTGAEADLREAIRLSPKSPVYLNYLGYSLLDRGLHMQEARNYVAEAFALQPENGAIIDSMGWAEYRMGNIPEAVRLLQKAREVEPSDPTVADHLGDALWKAGRKIEARHLWASAASLAPEAKLAANLAHKLSFGLDVPLPAAVAVAVGPETDAATRSQ